VDRLGDAPEHELAGRGRAEHIDLMMHRRGDGRVEPEGKTQAWIPVPSVNEKDWFKTIGSQWSNNGQAALARDPHYGAEMLHVQWADGEKAPVVEVTSKVSMQDRAVDLSKPGNASIVLGASERSFNTAGTELIQTDGIVKQSLGAGSETITNAQHCRAEVFLNGYGWVATDPADVRKVVLEEPPGNLPISDPKVEAARKTLFGAWEGNWLAYNTAHDVSLPGSTGPSVGFFMYPQAECAGSRLDCLDPDAFKYTITAKELAAA
jgi:hypothetical protein